MELEPRLVATSVPRAPEGVVLVLHGGAGRTGGAAVSPTQLSVLRMVPIAHAVARRAHGRLAVFRLLNSVRGWDTRHTPVHDAHWALDEVAARFGDLPAGLVGHSLGGRAAILAAAHPGVRSVVALNPWVYPSDGHGDLAGRSVLVVHGDQDRVADPGRAAAVVAGLRRSARVGHVTVAGGAHAMLSRGGVFTDLAADFTRSVLLGDEPTPTVEAALAGRDAVRV